MSRKFKIELKVEEKKHVFAVGTYDFSAGQPHYEELEKFHSYEEAKKCADILNEWHEKCEEYNKGGDKNGK